MGQQILTPKARPRAYSAYNIELGAEVCEAIGNGMLVHQIAKLSGMPSAATIYSWISKHAEFAVLYEAALIGAVRSDLRGIARHRQGRTGRKVGPLPDAHQDLAVDHDQAPAAHLQRACPVALKERHSDEGERRSRHITPTGRASLMTDARCAVTNQ
jgi:hypothetical protein